MGDIKKIKKEGSNVSIKLLLSVFIHKLRVNIYPLTYTHHVIIQTNNFCQSLSIELFQFMWIFIYSFIYFSYLFTYF